ncbi:MAG: PIN domain-containing protein [Acidobacteria bacterium]|nr:PIN domain-containing protein [Acidobacteriota bacterium]
MDYLLDSGFLYASLNSADSRHTLAVSIIGSIRAAIVLPVPAITEVAYLLKRDIGVEAAAQFVASLAASKLTLAAPEPDDYRRAAEIMRQYADANLDFVDALIVSIAERLNITRILTLDQRDFRLVRPRHCSTFEILP